MHVAGIAAVSPAAAPVKRKRENVGEISSDDNSSGEDSTGDEIEDRDVETFVDEKSEGSCSDIEYEASVETMEGGTAVKETVKETIKEKDKHKAKGKLNFLGKSVAAAVEAEVWLREEAVSHAWTDRWDIADLLQVCM